MRRWWKRRRCIKVVSRTSTSPVLSSTRTSRKFRGLAPDGLLPQVAQGAVGAVLEFYGDEPVGLAAAYEVTHFGTDVHGQANDALGAVAAVQEGQAVAGVAAVIEVDGPLGQLLHIGVSVADLAALLGMQIRAVDNPVQ